MSYKNVVTRLILPVLRKNYTHKSSALWITKRQLCNNTSHKPIIVNRTHHKFFHTSPNVRNIVSFNLSDIGEGIKEVIVREWYVKEGDKVSQFDNICEVQSDKASVTITSRYDGIIVKLYHAVDDIAQVGKPLVDIKVEGVETEVQKAEVHAFHFTSDVSEPKKEIKKDEKDIFAIPSVRRLAQEYKINLSEVKASGKGGRILKEDVLKYLEEQKSPKVTQKVAGAEEKESTYSKPIRGYAMAMIKTMTEAMEVPHFVYNDEISVTNLMKLREKVKPHSEKLDIRITYLPFFLKATSNALLKYPVLNSRLDEKKENIIFINNHNIGVAMDTPNGLVVPVIKNVQNKGILEISTELNRLQSLSKEARFSKEDLSDGTFTFSNIGAIGGTYASPIILPPQRAIIALGAFKKLPRFDANGQVVPENLAFISGAADHRVVDGATMANFINVLKKQIEEPLLLFLNL